MASEEPRPVAVHRLAEQFYCELQVDLGRRHRLEVESPALAAGSAAHAELESRAEPVSPAEVQRRVQAGEALALVELPLSGELGGLPVQGQPDHVLLQGRSARVVLEFKFSRHPSLWPAHVAQVEAYGLLLAQAGFDTASLVHAVALLPPAAAVPEGLPARWARLAQGLASPPWQSAPPRPGLAQPDPRAEVRPRLRRLPEGLLWAFPHQPEAAERHLGWALAYWRGERPPGASTSPGKCSACAFNAAGLCPVPRAPPRGRYRVERTADERGPLLRLWAE